MQRAIPNASVEMATVQQEASETRLWFHESKSILTVQSHFRLQYRNSRSPSKNSINRWYEQFKGTGNVRHRKNVGRPSVTDEIVHRVQQTFTP
ncbi:hypothetical protein AVEN_238131-1 [Araneus ventricosus]|uniref:DUF4817 domain-containing protein n=1 Tax=Araneus ventricosus TaxID=182803 RepID=A0A4Y1ZVR8_ARAVE|nr:hypothetical protein AVEN_238131-1 [Araneus ventricosus]